MEQLLPHKAHLRSSLKVPDFGLNVYDNLGFIS
jgi:hypothetical protein